LDEEVDRKSGVDFQLSCRRCIGLGANPKVDVQVTS